MPSIAGGICHFHERPIETGGNQAKIWVLDVHIGIPSRYSRWQILSLGSEDIQKDAHWLRTSGRPLLIIENMLRLLHPSRPTLPAFYERD
jgi:hypothetical protein